MAISLVEYAKEQARQVANSDTLFLERLLYFFELRIPAEASLFGDTKFFYPLIIPPQAYSITEPFSVEETFTQGSGLYVEENGILSRTIRLKGHTGFKPRTVNLSGLAVPAKLDISKKSYSRELPLVIVSAISGQRHFQYLQDSIFRTYGDLKRDPATAKDTMLLFHNPKDNEHWIVVPKSFTLDRDSSKPTLYNYDIELLVVDRGEEADKDFSEEQGILDTIKDGIGTIEKGLQLIDGAINDVSSVVNDVRLFVNDVVEIIDGINTIKDHVQDFIDGTELQINSAYNQVTEMIDRLDGATNSLNNTMELQDENDELIFPDKIRKKFFQMISGLELFGMYPHYFEPDTAQTMAKIRSNQNTNTATTSSRQTTALATARPTTLNAYRDLGTTLTAGDVESAKGTLDTGSGVKKFKSFKEVRIERGDTLASLAQKYLGDARQWQYIATINGLKPPFIDEQASAPLTDQNGTGLTGTATGADLLPFPKSLGIGSKVLIPSNNPAPKDWPLLPVAGVKNEEPSENHYLGTDLALVHASGYSGTGQVYYDLAINTDLGSVDLKTVSGLNNLGQALLVRLGIERGSDVLFRKLGTQRVVGLGFSRIDLELAKFRIIEAIVTDPRVLSVQNLRVLQTNDLLEIDLDARIRGFAESRSVKTAL